MHTHTHTHTHRIHLDHDVMKGFGPETLTVEGFLPVILNRNTKRNHLGRGYGPETLAVDGFLHTVKKPSTERGGGIVE